MPRPVVARDGKRLCYTSGLAYRRRRTGEPYQPSNGTDGDIFMSRFCERCTKDSEARPCKLLLRTIIHRVFDPEYPREWQYDAAGRPTCTAFVDKSQVPPRKRRRLRPGKGQTSFFGDQP